MSLANETRIAHGMDCKRVTTVNPSVPIELWAGRRYDLGVLEELAKVSVIHVLGDNVQGAFVLFSRGVKHSGVSFLP